MIIDFTVSNYRSIKEPVTLSFVAQKGRATKGDKNSTTPTDDSICAGYEVKGRDLKLLPVAAVFGANASGKSNVIRALDDLVHLMAYGRSSKKSVARDFVPFKLDENSSKEATNFEIRFLFDESIFIFYLSVQEGDIISERLEHSPPPTKRQSIRLLYSRILDKESDTYQVDHGSSFNGAHLQLINKLEKYETYLFVLHKLEIPLIENLSSWLQFSGAAIFSHYKTNMGYAAALCENHDHCRESVISLLRKFDTGLHDIRIENKSPDSEELNYQVQVVHNVNDNLAIWDIGEESLGTQELFALAGRIVSKLSVKSVLIIDEFGANFHPKITREIIKLFHNPESNPLGAQLIFTSHDNTLWRGVLRRDEIWLTEKGPDQATKLTPLSAYKPRNDLALDKAYLDGRFGGVPIIGDVGEAFEKASEEKELVDAA